jgi:hypothetical protein
VLYWNMHDVFLLFLFLVPCVYVFSSSFLNVATYCSGSRKSSGHTVYKRIKKNHNAQPFKCIVIFHNYIRKTYNKHNIDSYRALTWFVNISCLVVFKLLLTIETCPFTFLLVLFDCLFHDVFPTGWAECCQFVYVVL